jgi:hypothetical protein
LYSRSPYLDALIYQKVEGGWVVHTRQRHLHHIISEQLPVNDPTAIQVIHAEENQVTLGVLFDLYQGKGDSGSSRIYLIRFNEEPKVGSGSLAFVRPSFVNSVNGRTLYMPRHVLLMDVLVMFIDKIILNIVLKACTSRALNPICA